MPEPLDPQKFHILSAGQKKILMILGIFFALSVIPFTLYKYYIFSVNRPSQLDKVTDYEIKKGKTVSEIAEELYDKGAINSEFLFNVYILINGYEKNIQAGIYKIVPGSSIKDLAEQFQHGVNDTRITFLEGWRVEEFAREAVNTYRNIDYDDFVELARPYEGYLFPDTYYFKEDVEEETIVGTLRETFKEKTADVLTDKNLEKAGMTKEEAVIFASIVEREVNSAEDRPLVAGVLVKRWKDGAKLEADATTQFATAYGRLCPVITLGTCPYKKEDIATFNWWQNNLTQEDLDTDSPYNTRKNGGLPPAPISSISVSALEAVVNYKPSDYYFYLTDDKGVTHFAKTLDEHNSNVQKYLR